MTPSTPGLSIVIATHNRQRKLEALLESIRIHCVSELETVVIVDDSESAEDLTSKFPDLPLRHIRLPNRVFLTKARNLGWAECKSEFVFFIDDDNVILQATLREPLRLLRQTPTLGAVMPAVLYKDRPDLVWVYATPLNPHGWGHSLIGRDQPRAPGMEGLLLATDALPNAFVVRRRALEELGGFDESYVMSSSADFAIRLKRAGWDVRAFTGAFTLHDVEPPGRAGYWSSHRGTDPERVFHDVRDTFLLMRSLHGHERWFATRAAVRSMGFVLPNVVSYLLRGGSNGRKSIEQLARAYLISLRMLVRT